MAKAEPRIYFFFWKRAGTACDDETALKTSSTVAAGQITPTEVSPTEPVGQSAAGRAAGSPTTGHAGWHGAPSGQTDTYKGVCIMLVRVQV
eukprot:44925-Prymnesium_polylepis.1